jgi:hypothetical protein
VIRFAPAQRAGDMAFRRERVLWVASASILAVGLGFVAVCSSCREQPRIEGPASLWLVKDPDSGVHQGPAKASLAGHAIPGVSWRPVSRTTAGTRVTVVLQAWDVVREPWSRRLLFWRRPSLGSVVPVEGSETTYTESGVREWCNGCEWVRFDRVDGVPAPR